MKRTEIYKKKKVKFIKKKLKKKKLIYYKIQEDGL